jgi:hypothetical protein
VPKTVKRKKGPVSRKLLLELAVKQEPMIFDGLFDGQPIRKITNIKDLPPAWANRPVQPRVPAERINYPGPNLAASTVANFLSERAAGFVYDRLDLPPTNSPMVFPEAIAEWGYSRSGTGYYMANPGAFTHLHFDANGLHNLHYQVIGKKRFFLFPEHRSKYLAPQQQSSRVYLERIALAERRHFADYAGGYECILKPGDSLYVPAFMWHYVDYEQPGMSISTRFGQSQHIEAMIKAIGGFHSTAEFQHIGAGLLDDDNVSPPYEDAWQQVLATIGSQYNFDRVQEKLLRLCEEVCPEKVECLYGNWQDFSLAVS